MKPFLLLLLVCGLAEAQDAKPLDHEPWDFGVWAGGGFNVPGGTKDTQTLNAGVRLGKVLTDESGPGFLRGVFEWSADLLPVYFLFQPAKNAYAEGFNPVNLKWNFTAKDRAVPYLELGGGVLFSSTDVPANTSRVNFVTHGALGLQIFSRDRRAVSMAARFEHISNAGLTVPNPGINSVQFSLGYNWFK